MTKWKNATSEVILNLDDEMRDELGLFEDSKSLSLRVKHSGYDFPAKITADPYYSEPPESELEIHELEGEIINEEGDETPLSATHIEIIWNSKEIFETIEDLIWEE